MEYLIVAILACLFAQFVFGFLKWVLRAAIVALVLCVGLIAIADRPEPGQEILHPESAAAEEQRQHGASSERAGRAVGHALDRAAEGARRAADEAGAFARGVLGR